MMARMTWGWSFRVPIGACQGGPWGLAAATLREMVTITMVALGGGSVMLIELMGCRGLHCSQWGRLGHEGVIGGGRGSGKLEVMA